MTFAAGIRAVQVSPDRKLLVVETNAPRLGAETPDQKYLGGPPVKVMMFPLGEKKPLAESSAKVPTLLPLMGDGLLDLLEGRAQGSWVMRDVPFQGKPQTVAEVRSSCQPSARPLSASVVLMVGCYGDGDDRAGDCGFDEGWGAVAGSLAEPVCVGMVRLGGEREPVRV